MSGLSWLELAYICDGTKQKSDASLSGVAIFVFQILKLDRVVYSILKNEGHWSYSWPVVRV